MAEEEELTEEQLLRRKQKLNRPERRLAIKLSDGRPGAFRGGGEGGAVAVWPAWRCRAGGGQHFLEMPRNGDQE